MPQRPPIPCLRYERADLAIDFLCDALGFARHAVFADDADPTIIHHAQLSYGDGMVMLGSAGNGGPAEALYGWQTPARLGGITQCVCLIVDDVEAHCAQATAAGAEIVTAPHDNDGYPGRSYDVRDPGGNIWNITTYDPWDA